MGIAGCNPLAIPTTSAFLIAIEYGFSRKAKEKRVRHIVIFFGQSKDGYTCKEVNTRLFPSKVLDGLDLTNKVKRDFCRLFDRDFTQLDKARNGKRLPHRSANNKRQEDKQDLIPDESTWKDSKGGKKKLLRQPTLRRKDSTARHHRWPYYFALSEFIPISRQAKNEIQ